MQCTSRKLRFATLLAMALVAGLSACSSKTGESEKLLAARTTVERASSLVNTPSARADLETARASLARAEAARKKDRPQTEIDNFAYSAEQSATAAINRQEAELLQKEAGTAASEEHQRDSVMALHKAETAETEAARVQQLAQQSADAR